MRNFIKHIFAITCLLASASSGTIAAENCCVPLDYSFYIKAGTGVSCSAPTNVKAPPPAWDPAFQGYKATVGNRAIASFAIGCEFMHCMDVEASISTRSIFKYRKFQTSVNGGGSYTREFDLDVTPILFSVNLLGRDIPCLNWDIACGTIYPVLGVGLGSSNLLITNFRTVGLPPSGGSAPFASFSNENQRTCHTNFTYTALLGFEYNCDECWAISTGYRYFDAGKFRGPRFIRVSTGDAVDVAGEAWKMRFRANEWFVELKVFL